MWTLWRDLALTSMDSQWSHVLTMTIDITSSIAYSTHW